MLIGYARVSTHEQNISVQKIELEKIGCEKIFEDLASGTNKNRPGLNITMEVIRSGDTLVVWKLDRLARSLKHLLTVADDLEKRNVNLKSLTDNIDTSTPSGRFFFHIMGSLAEMERELIAERTRAGLKAARDMGRVGGRKRLMTDSKILAAKKLLSANITAKEVAKNLGVSLPTLYRWIPACGL